MFKKVMSLLCLLWLSVAGFAAPMTPKFSTVIQPGGVGNEYRHIIQDIAYSPDGQYAYVIMFIFDPKDISDPYDNDRYHVKLYLAKKTKYPNDDRNIFVILDSLELNQYYYSHEKGIFPKITVHPENELLYIEFPELSSPPTPGIVPGKEQKKYQLFYLIDASGEDLKKITSLTYHFSSEKPYNSKSNSSRIVTDVSLFTKNALQIRAERTAAAVVQVPTDKNQQFKIFSSAPKNANDDTKDINSLHISMTPDEKYVYIASGNADDEFGKPDVTLYDYLHVFTYDKSTKKIAFLKSYVTEGRDVFSKEGVIEHQGHSGSDGLVTADGKFYYTVGGPDFADKTGKKGAGVISIYSIEDDGSLRFIKAVKPENESVLYSRKQQMEITPDQKYLYILDQPKKEMSIWQRNLTTGDIILMDTYKSEIDDGTWDYQFKKMDISSDGTHIYAYSDSVFTTYDLRTDLSLVKKGVVDPADSGEIDYTLAVSNTYNDAHNVVVRDVLPKGMSFISGSVNAENGSCSAEGQVVQCTIGTILKDENYNAVIKVKAPWQGGKITNTANVSSDQLELDEANNTDSATNTVKAQPKPEEPKPEEPKPEEPKPENPPKKSSGGGSFPITLFALIGLLFIRRKPIYVG